jgi:hypothetical protein
MQAPLEKNVEALATRSASSRQKAWESADYPMRENPTLSANLYRPTRCNRSGVAGGPAVFTVFMVLPG